MNPARTHIVIPEPPPEPLPAAVALAFAPLHKRAFGVALGTAAAVLIFGITAIHLLREPTQADGMSIQLLANFFYGYSMTWQGAFIGAFWAFVMGFTAGWFVAFCRNLVIAISIFITRTRVELQETRDFLDHI